MSTADSQLILMQGPSRVHEYFWARVRRNLRVVVCLDPSSPQFHIHLNANPALLSGCTMHWWRGLSDDSLVSLATAQLQVRPLCWVPGPQGLL